MSGAHAASAVSNGLSSLSRSGLFSLVVLSVNLSLELSVELSSELSALLYVELSAELSVELSIDLPVEPPLEGSVELSVDLSVELSIDVSVETPDELPVKLLPELVESPAAVLGTVDGDSFDTGPVVAFSTSGASVDSQEDRDDCGERRLMVGVKNGGLLPVHLTRVLSESSFPSLPEGRYSTSNLKPDSPEALVSK